MQFAKVYFLYRQYVKCAKPCNYGLAIYKFVLIICTVDSTHFLQMLLSILLSLHEHKLIYIASTPAIELIWWLWLLQLYREWTFCVCYVTVTQPLLWFWLFLSTYSFLPAFVFVQGNTEGGADETEASNLHKKHSQTTILSPVSFYGVLLTLSVSCTWSKMPISFRNSPKY